MLLVKGLNSAKQDKNEKIVNNFNDGLIDLRNDINRKKNPWKWKSKEVVSIVEETLTLKNQER